ncbi:hypothetical protein HN385_04805 [archaeon]|jgi:hypothetical protein|nr:hypothetical protein [archaeon]MBT3451042.1 hypothetical protein [archaeon]MBT6869132.1 hypothetical protein [archaeon]MBT7192779.1 hypothetical protein [archaeon]MBT7381319.1 hypothetical protein [archaeon]
MDFGQAVKLYHERMQLDERFQDIYSVAKQIMAGEHWLVGGSVFRPLVEIMYEREQPLTDFDFVCDTIKNDIVLPEGYYMVRNSYGNPKIRTPETDFDCVPFNSWKKFKFKSPGINSVLIQNPTTVQSLAYNPDTGEVKGLGKHAIKRQEIQVNNLHYLLKAANSKKISMADYLKRFDSLGFNLVSGYLIAKRNFPLQIEHLC